MSPWMFVVTVLAGLILLAMVRLIRGPTSANRVVAMDAINTLVVAIMIVLSVVFKQVIFIDVAIV